MEHVIPEDSFNHIQSFACGCNPTVIVSEGEESYIHREIGETISWMDKQSKAWWEDWKETNKRIKLSMYEQNTNK